MHGPEWQEVEDSGGHAGPRVNRNDPGREPDTEEATSGYGIFKEAVCRVHVRTDSPRNYLTLPF